MRDDFARKYPNATQWHWVLPLTLTTAHCPQPTLLLLACVHCDHQTPLDPLGGHAYVLLWH